MIPEDTDASDGKTFFQEGRTRISIVIPVYNGERTLRQCLESIFQSRYPRYECIIVDDHSSDDTLKIAESFKVTILRFEQHNGAAFGRNRGAEIANGDILLFVDADVVIYADSLEKVAAIFEKDPDLAAVFGSYDDLPGDQGFYSQYKNLFHHYIHQTSREDAGTFWTAFGAIRKRHFVEVGRFNEQRRMMEDIELGYRLKAKNMRIQLNRGLVVKHLKRYTLSNLLKSDLFDRAIPWTILILGYQEAKNDLNLKWEHKVSAMLGILMAGCALAALAVKEMALIIPLLFGIFLFLNLHFYSFFAKKRGWFFALRVIPMHLLYYLYGILGYGIGYWKFHLRGARF